jgi:hypothetical protein
MLRAAGNAGAEIEFVGATSNNGNFGLSLLPLGLQQGDLVVFVASDDTANFTFNSSGWTGVNLSFSSADTSSLGAIHYVVCYKEMGASPDSFLGLNTTVDFLGAIAFRNAQWASTTNETIGTTVSRFASLPSLSISNSGSVAIYLAMLDDDDATVDTTPTNYTLATSNGRLGGSGAIFYRLDLSSGTESPADVRWSSNDEFLNIGLVLEPV